MSVIFSLLVDDALWSVSHIIREFQVTLRRRGRRRSTAVPGLALQFQHQAACSVLLRKGDRTGQRCPQEIHGYLVAAEKLCCSMNIGLVRVKALL